MEPSDLSRSAVKPRRKSDGGVTGMARPKPSSDRRTRRRHSGHRKSGPKSNDIQQARLEGKEYRKRLSEGRQRSSKNRVSMTRRERPSLEALGHAGLKRSMSHAETPGAKPGQRFFMEVDEAPTDLEEKTRVQNIITPSEAQMLDASTWTSTMITYAIRGILSSDRASQLRCINWLRMVLGASEVSPAGEIVGAGLVPRLVDFLRARDFPELVPQALCVLTNIAASDHTRAVVEEPGAIEMVVQLLRHPNDYIQEQSAWCLGNITGDSTELRDRVLDAGVMDPLLFNLENSSSPKFLRTGMWALGNCCGGVPAPPLSVVAPSLSVIRSVICGSRGDEVALEETGWVLYNITRGGVDQIDAVLSAGLVPRLPDLLLHDRHEVVIPIVRAMDNMACSSGGHRGALIAAGALDPLVEMLGHESSKVRADVLRLLSSIAAGSYDQVAAVVSTPDVIPSVMTELEEGNAACRQEAAWVFFNMCQCGFEVHERLIPILVQHGVLSAVCHNLDRQEEPESLVVMLGLLFTILDEASREADSSRLDEYLRLVEEADGLDRTVNLMHEHEDMEVYDKALDIVRAFVDGEDDEGLTDDENAHVGDVDGGKDQDCESDISNDSLSDDSFHPELNHVPFGINIHESGESDMVQVASNADALRLGSGIRGEAAGFPVGVAGGNRDSRSAAQQHWHESRYEAGDEASPEGVGGSLGIVGAIERFMTGSASDSQSTRSFGNLERSSGKSENRNAQDWSMHSSSQKSGGSGKSWGEELGSSGQGTDRRHADGIQRVRSNEMSDALRSGVAVPSADGSARSADQGKEADGQRRLGMFGPEAPKSAAVPSLFETGSGIAAAFGIGDIMGASRSRKSDVSRAPNARLMSSAQGYDFEQTE